MRISYYEESGKQGGCEGLDFDTRDCTVCYSHLKPVPLSLENADDVQWAIEGRIRELEEEIKRIEEKLLLKAEKKVRIEGGYRLLVPPSDKMREILVEKKWMFEKDIEKIRNIDLLKLIQSKKKI